MSRAIAVSNPVEARFEWCSLLGEPGELVADVGPTPQLFDDDGTQVVTDEGPGGG